MKFKDVEKINEIQELTHQCNQHLLALWAAECVEHVIKYYKIYYPTDYRVFDAINVAKGYATGQVSVIEARRVASDASKAAKEAEVDNNLVASSVARAACQAASTAHVRTNALSASTSSVKAKAYSKGGDITVVQKEREWQYNRLVALRKASNQN